MCYNLVAQDDLEKEGIEYEEMHFLYIDDKYDKLIVLAQKYIDDPEHAKSPLPYLYMGIALHYISKHGEYAEIYPKALKNSLKYIVKFQRKDKNSIYAHIEEEFFYEFRRTLLNEIQFYYEQGNKKALKKAYYFLKDYVKYDPSNIGTLLLKFVVDHMLQKPDFHHSLHQADKLLKSTTSKHIDKYAIYEKDFFFYALRKYLIYCKEHKNSNLMKKTLTVGSHLKNVKRFKELYDEFYP